MNLNDVYRSAPNGKNLMHLVTVEQLVHSPLIAEVFTAEGKPLSYATFVGSLMKEMGDPVANMHHACTGICGEAGELLDASKKQWAYGKKLDMDNVLEELGDVMFYLQSALLITGFTFENIIDANYVKLQKRYKDGYSDAAAIARADKAEVEIKYIVKSEDTGITIAGPFDTYDQAMQWGGTKETIIKVNAHGEETK